MVFPINVEITLDIDEVLVALKRPEGYEDVHPELVAEDALQGWPEYRVFVVPNTRYHPHPADNTGDNDD